MPPRAATSESFLYLTTIGRTTGRRRTIEIWFVEKAARHYVVSEGGTEAGWVKNLAKNPRVWFSIGARGDRQRDRRETEAIARTVARGPAARDARVLMRAKYGWPEGDEGLVVEIR